MAKDALWGKNTTSPGPALPDLPLTCHCPRFVLGTRGQRTTDKEHPESGEPQPLGCDGLLVTPSLQGSREDGPAP